MVWLICSPGSVTNAASVPPDPVERRHGCQESGLQVEDLPVGLYIEDGGGLAGWPPVFGVGDPGDVVAQGRGVGGRDGGGDRRIGLVEVRGDQVPLQHGDMRQVGVVQRDPGGDAQRHPRVDGPGPGDGAGVGLDHDVNRGQVGHRSASFP